MVAQYKIEGREQIVHTSIKLRVAREQGGRGVMGESELGWGQIRH